MRVLNINKLSEGTLTYSSQLSKYQFNTAFEDTALSCYGKFDGHIDQHLQVSYDVATSIYYSYILNTNLSADASVILIGSDDNFTTSTSYPYARVGTGYYFRHDTGLNFKSYRTVVSDSGISVPARLSKFYLGGYTQLPGANPEVDIPLISSAKSEKSDSGQIYGLKKIILKQRNVSFDYASLIQREQIESWFYEYDKIYPFILLIYEDSLDVEPPLYCNMTDIDIKQTNIPHMYKITLKFEECK